MVDSADPLIEVARSLGNSGFEFQDACSKLDSEIFDSGAFSPSLFSDLMVVLQDARLHNLGNSAYFLKIFEFNVDLLTEAQKKQLFDSLKLVLGSFCDEAAAILGVELLVDFGDGLETFNFLKTVAADASHSRSRSLAVHGLSWLAKGTDDSHLRNSCLSEIAVLAGSKDVAVSAEAKAELRRRAKDSR